MTLKMMIPFVLRMREDCWPKGKRDLVGENMLGRMPVTQAGIQSCVKCSFAVKKVLFSIWIWANLPKNQIR